MNRKYFRRTKSYEDNEDPCYFEAPLMSNISIFENDNAPIPTGILDKHGYELFAVEEKLTIGFLQRVEPKRK